MKINANQYIANQTAASASKPGAAPSGETPVDTKGQPNLPSMGPVSQEGMQAILNQGSQKVRSMTASTPRGIGSEVQELRRSAPEAAQQLTDLSRELLQKVTDLPGPIAGRARELVGHLSPVAGNGSRPEAAQGRPAGSSPSAGHAPNRNLTGLSKPVAGHAPNGGIHDPNNPLTVRPGLAPGDDLIDLSKPRPGHAPDDILRDMSKILTAMPHEDYSELKRILVLTKSAYEEGITRMGPPVNQQARGDCD